MIGNDLIEIEKAFSNSRLHNFRFRKKVFTASEEKIIDSSENRELTFWILWSMKEAAYKVHQRLTKAAPKLNPFAFECSISSDYNSGTVKIGECHYFVKIRISEKHIHTVATADKNLTFLHKFYQVGQDYKKLFSEYISEELKLSEPVSVTKDKSRIPSFQNKNSKEKMPLSISHDGKYAALVFPLINS